MVGLLGDWVGLTAALAVVGPPSALALAVVARWAMSADPGRD
ncbi:MAG: hypothetical protein ACR2H3_14150 [Acidimicrobiales bacterium]